MAMLWLLGFLVALSQSVQKSACDDLVKDKIIDELMLRVASLESRALEQDEKIQRQSEELQHQSEVLQQYDALQAQVDKLADERKNDLVAFSVSLSSNKDTAIGEAVKYDRVFTNTGDVYSTETGLFTAPASGYYFFSVSSLKCDDKFEKVSIRINGEQMAVIVTADGSITASSSAVGYLEAGQTAYIQAEEADGNGACLYGGDHSTFCGFLVSI